MMPHDRASEVGVSEDPFQPQQTCDTLGCVCMI